MPRLDVFKRINVKGEYGQHTEDGYNFYLLLLDKQKCIYNNT